MCWPTRRDIHLSNIGDRWRSIIGLDSLRSFPFEKDEKRLRVVHAAMHHLGLPVITTANCDQCGIRGSLSGGSFLNLAVHG